MTEPKPRRLVLQRTGPAFDVVKEAVRLTLPVVIDRRIANEIHSLLAEHIPHLSQAVRCALRQALESK